jgi:tetratricopeptide (TPR) repeat protein
MKALEKDRNHRYESASALAADIQRYLDDEPVQACPPSAGYRLRKFARRNRGRVAASAGLLLSGVVVACLLIAYYLQSAGRLRQLSQGVQEALAGARTAIEAGNLVLASQRVAEAQGRLGTAWDQLKELAAEVVGVQQEIAAREAEEARFHRFLKLVTEVENIENKSATREEIISRAEETLGVYSVLTNEVWVASLDRTYLTASQKQQVREAAYVVLLFLADYHVRWLPGNAKPEAKAEAAARGLGLLRRAEAFHQPTRGFYYIRQWCHHDQGRAAAAEEDTKRYKAMAGITAWDYFLPGHTAGWGGDLKEAMRSYRAALALQPDHYNSLFFLAMRLKNDEIKRYPEAIAYFTGCIALRPNHTYAYGNRADCHQRLGQLDEAIADYREAIRLKKDFAEAHSNLGLALKDKGQLDEAIAECREAIRLKKDFAEAHNNLGITLHDKGQLNEAITEYREAIRLKKDFAVAHYNLGNALRDKGQLDEAITEYREAIRLMKDFAEAHRSLGNALSDKGQLDEGIAEYREAIRLKKDYAEAHTNLGNALRGKGRLDEAIAQYREAIHLKKEDAVAHNNLGAILCDVKGDYDGAIAEFCEAIRIEKDYAYAHHNLGEALRHKGQLDEAIAEYREAIRIKKDDAGFHYNLGTALSLKGQWDEVIAERREIIRLKKDNAEAHNNLAWLLATCPDVRFRNPSQAVTHAKKAVELAPYMGAYWNTLGVAHYRNGEWKAAVETLMKSAQLREGGDSYDFFFLAMAHWQLNERDKARAWYDQAVAWMDKNQPQDEELKRFRAEATALLGMEKAVQKQKK